MNSKQIISAKAQEILDKGQQLQLELEEKQAQIAALQREISEIGQTLLVYEGAYKAYTETLNLLETPTAEETTEA